jgi:rod shape-determining protein MreC
LFGRLLAVALGLVVLAALIFGGRFPLIAAIQGVALDAVAPIQDLVTSSFQDVAGTGRTVATVDQLIAENARLKAENDRLTRDAAITPELQRQNEELRQLLGIRQAGGNWQWLPGRVISLDPSNLVRSITLDVGSSEGLVDGMTVMTPRGLVGKIVKIGRNAVQVLLITDPSSSANAMVQRSRARGVVYGQRGPAGTSSLVMKFIPQGEEIRAGDRVITSGLGGIFPEGIALGQVAQVRQRDTDMFQEATIEPYVDFARLETVLVILNHQPVKLD